METGISEAESSIRVDRWLWFARFFKSRSLAAKLVQGRKVRLNSVAIAKPSVQIKQGDVLTFPQAKEIRVVKILGIGERRGPAPEAQMLYEDLAPKETTATENEPALQQGQAFRREKGAGRPTKSQRRALDRFKSDPSDSL
jgi:ribosome-associated heat shock protein Hsp15